ncbi:DUF4097 family beta strand repeat-containing protein [Streptomyces sp. NPDC003077]|uniref:DUF4097 family beta strand repeat-containing protein n=1 Tax=Streptomyces sp. NPDC003077 TaxID=3154443 RepID=UPI00339F2FFE
MPEFETPEPISVTFGFDIGTIRFTAEQRTRTVVEVRPGNEDDEVDVRAARQTQVTYANGTLVIKGPKKRSLFGRSGSIDVSVELPAGSDVVGSSPMADILCEGRLGDCDLKTSAGDIRVAEADGVTLRTGFGDTSLDRATGNVDITGHGRVDVGEVAGTATLKNLGDTTIGEVNGELRVRSSIGRISVGVAHGDVEARCASGHIRVEQVARGKVTLRTGAGDLEVGVRENSAAWLDVSARAGGVHNSLTPSDGPGASEETVEIRANTGLGDIVIRRPQ